MLTQKIIRQEIDELKTVMASDSLVIPSFWDCAKPGVMILLWLFFCPFMAFSLSGETAGNILVSVGFSSFVGLMILFAVTNARGLILSIPTSYREKSEVMMFLQNKIRNYTLCYMVFVLFISFLGAYSNTAAMLYLMPLMFITGGFVFFFSADISRYKLSAFTEIVKAVKAQ
ncbi:hypothetical protein [Serratia nevei]|uniref:hypothetical protein n=1 Tax=Serratia nevei TaxID=2703794 RepID=UPI0011F3F640|nr:hypothetical protein [Serratia nevei]HEJ7857726.1 hypothetical protein [Serratia marcescens]